MLSKAVDWLRHRWRLRRERALYRHVADVHDLPPIFHYWSHTYVRPMLQELGVASPETFFVRFLSAGAEHVEGRRPRFLSLGSGTCDTEIEVARGLVAAGLDRFTITCVDLNRALLRRGLESARRVGLGEHVEVRCADLNRWRPDGRFDGVMANHSLHHVVGLEHVFDGVRAALTDRGKFVVSDMIGRNGHLRWPEARAEVERFWAELPTGHRFNRQSQRQCAAFEDQDCSADGFEGIRAQDILPLLLQRFGFEAFVGFANVVDVFVDRGYGPNFDVAQPWDRSFIDRIHARDEQLLRERRITPTHMFAVMGRAVPAAPFYSRGLAPGDCVRRQDGGG